MNKPGGGRLTILIASPLEAEQARRIADAAPDRIRVLYDPDLLPIPRWPADHEGTSRQLDARASDLWRSHLGSADIMFDFDWFEPDRMALNAPRLRWVQATSAGIEGYVRRTGLADTGITVTTAAGVHAVPLAEHVVLGLLYLVKDVSQLKRWQSTRHWEHRTVDVLVGRRAMVIGLGNVGRQIARTCAGLGLEVWGLDPNASEPPDGVARLVSRSELGAALAEIDALVIACPHTPETHHMIGAEEIAAMRPSAMVVNVGRGAVIDEPELVRALQEGRLSGAALDVFEEEPLPNSSPLWSMDNVLLSPHSVSAVASENKLITDLFIDNLHRYLGHEPLRNVFDKSRGY